MVENTNRFLNLVKKRENLFGLEVRALMDDPWPMDLSLKASYWLVDRHGVGADFPEEETTGLRIEVGFSIDL